MSPSIRIAIADDHAIFRQGIISIVTKYGFKVVAEADNGAELLTALEKLTPLPEVCILDINMPVMNGFATLAALRTQWPDIHVIALLMYDSELPIIKMLQGGASGYLLKDCKPSELRLAIETVVAEGFYHSEITDDKIPHSLPPERARLSHITDKEITFLSWCCCDLGYKEIADKLGISTRTAESYAEILCGKLGVKSRIGLVMAAIQMAVKPALG